MEKKFIIEKKELFFLLVNLITIKMFFTYPRQLTSICGNAAWIQCIYVSLICIAVYLITINLYKKAGTVNILELSERIGGRSLKIVIGILLTVTLLINAAITMRTLPESVKTVLLPLTPMRFLLIILSICIAIGAYSGLYSIARIHALFIPISAIVFVVMILLLIPNVKLNNIFPILGKGTYNIFFKGLGATGIFSDIIVLYLILPFCRNFNDAKSIGTKAIITAAAISVFIVFFYNILYPYPTSEEFILPVYQMTRLIKIGDFFQRLEAIFEFFWSISMLLYSAMYLFIVCYIWKEIFNLKYYKQLVFPFIIIFSAISYLPSSTTGLTHAGNISSYVTIPSCLILPAVIALIYRLRFKNSNKHYN